MKRMAILVFLVMPGAVRMQIAFGRVRRKTAPTGFSNVVPIRDFVPLRVPRQAW